MSPARAPRNGSACRSRCLSNCHQSAWALAQPDIATLRPGPLTEFPVYAAQTTDGVKTATAGVTDALTLTAEGWPTLVVDWKCDVTLASGTRDHYRAQVRAYLDMTGAERGLTVPMTSGAVIPVLPTEPTESEAA